MIPKIIHYVWVGNSPKPELVLKCIESWKKYCSDYKIIEWNNDILSKIDNAYVKEAYEHKKWAFVSDYLRLYALYHHGGFYFDTDLELTQNIDDFRKHDFVTGYENYKGNFSPITALMGAQKQNIIIKELLSEYNNIHFVVNGKIDQTTNTVRITKYFHNHFGLSEPYNGNEKTVLNEKSIIFPSYLFCTPEDKKENYAIHHFNGSWLDAYKRKDVFSFGKYKLVKFKKLSKLKSEDLPIEKNEKKLLKFTCSNKKVLCILKEIK